MKNKTLRIVVIAAVVLIVLAVVGKQTGIFGKEFRHKVAIEAAQTRNVTELITANGRIQPETEVKISPEISGEIVELNVKEGDDVKAGDLLVKIKPETYESLLSRAQAALDQALARKEQSRASLIQSELSYERNKKLFEQQAISESDYESAEASYNIAKADFDAAKYSVKSSEAAVIEARENLIKTTIYAPMSGTVSKLDVEKGERVLGTSMMTGTEMMRIADLDRMEAVVEVNENDIIRVSKGDTAIIEVDAYLDYEFMGIVTEIANSATTTGVTVDQVTSFNVKILLLKESYKDLLGANIKSPFRPGMSATVDIRTDTKYDILTVPIQAVTTRKDSIAVEGSDVEPTNELKEVVFLYRADTVYQVGVKTGIQDNSFIEILSGISAQDEVVIAPYTAISKRLKDMDLVEKVEEKDLFEEK